MVGFIGTDEKFEEMSYALSSLSRLWAWIYRVINENQDHKVNVWYEDPMGGTIRTDEETKEFNITFVKHITDGEPVFEFCILENGEIVDGLFLNSDGTSRKDTDGNLLRFYEKARTYLNVFPVYAVLFKDDYVRDTQVYMGPEDTENGPDPLSDKWFDKPRAEVLVGLFRAFSPEVAIGAAVREYEDYERWMFTAYPAP